MKRNFRVWALSCLLSLVVMATSCEGPQTDNPEPKPEPQEPPKSERPEATNVNTYIINDTEYAFGSVAAMMVEENLLIVGTPQSGCADAESLFGECEEYFYGAVSPLLVGKKIDVKNERKLFTLLSTIAGAEIETLSPDYPEEAEEGEMTLSYADGVVTLVGWVECTNGTELAFNMRAEQRVDVIQDVVYRGSESKPVRTTIHQVDGDNTTLWFTPAGLEHAGELEIASWYMSLTVSNSLLDKEIDITSLPDGASFVFTIVDNLNADGSLSISSEDLQGAKGFFEVGKIGDSEYNVIVDIEIADVGYGVQFEGESMEYYIPEVRTNYLTYGKKGNQQEIALVSASIDCTTDVWIVELVAADQSVLSATVPANFFTGEAKGFSQSPNLAVTYNGRTYSKANKDSGTIWASLTEADNSNDAPTLHFEFMGYDDLSCIYTGKCMRK